MLGFGSWPPKIGEQKHRKNTSFETTNPVEPSQPHVNIKLRTGPSDWEAGHRKLLGFAHLQLQLLRLDGERKLLGGSNWGNRRGLKFWAVKKSTSTHFNTIAAVVVIIIVIIIITIITIMSIMTIITIIYVCVCASLLALDSIRLYDHWVWASSLIKRGKYEGPPHWIHWNPWFHGEFRDFRAMSLCFSGGKSRMGIISTTRSRGTLLLWDIIFPSTNNPNIGIIMLLLG